MATNILGGTGRFGDPLRIALKHVTRAGSRSLVEAAAVLETEIKSQLSRPGTGREYRRGRKVHVASAPGEPPAVDTGRLRASIGHEEVTILGAVLSIRVGTNLVYAAPLEYGTRDGRIKPRPFMRPALAAAQGRMSNAVGAELRRARIPSR